MDKDNVIPFENPNTDKPSLDQEDVVYTSNEEYLEETERNEEIESEDNDGTSPLPTGLYHVILKQFAAAAIIAIIVMIVLVWSKDVHVLIGLIVSGYFCYLALSIILDWKKGNIIELVVLCNSATISGIRKAASVLSESAARTKVVFKTVSDEPRFLSFSVPGDKTSTFIPNVSYVIYFRRSAQGELLGYVQI